MGFVIIKLNKVPTASDGTAAWQWAKFFASNSEAEMAELAKDNESIEKGRMILVKLSKDEKAQYAAEREEKIRRDYQASMNFARSEGLAEGEAKGKHDNAARMKADGMDIALIEKYTGLSRKEISEL